MPAPAKGSQQRTALISVGAAILLIAVKLGTGLATGSLAFLAEAGPLGHRPRGRAADAVRRAGGRPPRRSRPPVRPRQGPAPGRARRERVPGAGFAGPRLPGRAEAGRWRRPRRRGHVVGHRGAGLRDRPGRVADGGQPPRGAASFLGRAGRQRAALRLGPGRIAGGAGGPAVRAGGLPLRRRHRHAGGGRAGHRRRGAPGPAVDRRADGPRHRRVERGGRGGAGRRR